MKFKRKLITIVTTLSLMLSVFSIGINAQESIQTKNKGSVIRATDYGADPSGKKDSTLAVAKALDAAKKIKGPVTLEFPQGEYHFYKENATQKVIHTSNTSSLSYPTKWISFLIEGQEDLTIDGLGSQLIFHGDVMAMAVIDSKRINLNNFVLDYKDADTVDLTVVGNGAEDGKEYTDFYVPENYNYTINENKKEITWQGDIDPNTGKPYWEGKNSFGAYLVVYKGFDETVSRHQARNANGDNASDPFTDVTNIEYLGENRLRFTYKKTRPTAHELGNIFLLTNSARRTTAGAFISESDTVHMNNLDVHYLSGFGWLLQMSKNIEFNGVNFLPRFGSGKYTSSNADQIHAAGVGGYMNVLNSNFSMAHDDPMNIHGTYLRTEEVIDNKTIRMRYIHGQQGGFRQYHPGDEIVFYSRTYLDTPKGVSEDKPFIVESSIAPGEVYNGKALSMRDEIVTFKDEIPEAVLAQLRTKIVRQNEAKDVEPMYVAENITYSPKLTIKGNKMKSIPTRGILASVRKEVIIEDNIFENMTMANIYLSNDADYWYESGPIRDMTIKGNKFYIRPTGQSEWGNVSGIFIDPVIVRPYAWKYEDGSSPLPEDMERMQVHKGIKIIENEFHMANDNVVTAEGVDGMEIRDNKIIRDNPDVRIKLSSAQNNVELGKPVSLTTSVKENTLDKEMFKFTNSKNISISGNHYDDGFNMNITTSNMKASEITNEDSELEINGPKNVITADSKLKFVTADPAVAFVNEYQEVVGLKEGASTEIVAYYEWNGSVYTSNIIPIEVGRVAGSKLDATLDKNVLTAENETAKLTVNGSYDTIEVLDPITLKVSSVGKVEDLTYTALREGVALLRLSNEHDTVSLIVSNKMGETYGHRDYLDRDNISISQENANWHGLDRYNLSIKGEAGDLYGGGTNVKNIIQYDIPTALKNDFRVQIAVKDLPKNGVGSYLNGGIMLYEDGNNYLSLGKKSHKQGFAMVNERKGSSTEIDGVALDNNVSDTTLEIAVSNGRATLKALRPDGTWFTTGEFDVSDIMPQAKIAMTSWNQGSNPIFGELKFAKASEVTSEELATQVSVPLFTQGEVNVAPIATEAILTDTTINSETTVNYSYTDGDSDAQGRTIFEWINIHDGVEDVVYTTSPSYRPRFAGTLQVKIIPVDVRGKVGNAVESNIINVQTTVTSDVNLNSLYLNGLEVSNFASDKLEYEITVPSAHRILHIAYDQADAGILTQVENSQGNILSEVTSDNHLNIEVPQDGIVNLIRQDSKGSKITYTINVKTVESNDTSIKGILVNGKAVDQEILAGSNSYFIELADEENVVDLEIEGATQEQILSATRSFFEYEVENQAKQGSFNAEVNLTAGLNAFYINVLAADGISSRTVRVYVYRSGYNDADVSDIAINGKTIPGFDPNVYDYILNVTPEEAANFNLSVGNYKEKDQNTSITINNQRSEGSNITTQFDDERNTIIITNQAEDMWTNQFYTLHLIVQSDDNANLQNLSSDGEVLSPNFDSDVTLYDIRTSNREITLNAVSEINGATIKMYTDTEYSQNVDRHSGTFKLYSGKNTVHVAVIALDGTTVKLYTVNVSVSDDVYLSDLDANDVQNGYLDLAYDKSHSNQKIALGRHNDKNELVKVEYDKGLGAHAPSRITYDITDQGYEQFESFIGIDWTKIAEGKNEADVKFKVIVDGEVQYTSETMTDKTPQEFVSIDVRDAKELVLVIDSLSKNWSDHANWADAKFVRVATLAPEVSKDALQALVTQSNELESKDYTKLSWNAFEAALTHAKSVLNDSDAYQIEVDEALEALQLALDELVIFVPEVNKTLLEKLVKEVEKLNESKYTPATWNALKTALDHAKAVLVDISADQSAVDTAGHNLKLALDNLLVIQPEVNKKELQSLVDQANELESTDYTEASWLKLQSELNQAISALKDDNSSQEAIDTIVKSLGEAMRQLEIEVPQVDKSALEAFIENVANLNPLEYTKTSWDVFDNEFKYAKFVLLSDEVQQVEVDEALRSLKLAYENLVTAIVDLDTSKLENLINVADAITNLNSTYTEDSFAELQRVLAEAKDALHSAQTQDIIDASIQALQEAIEGLKKIDGTSPVHPIIPDKPVIGNRPVDPVKPLPPTGFSSNSIFYGFLLIAGGYVLVEKRKKRFSK